MIATQSTESLEQLIASLPDAADMLYVEDGRWLASSEWLVGTFAGRSFPAERRPDAIQSLAAYLDAHVGHDSIVGRSVTRSGWPDLAAVGRYLDRERPDGGDRDADPQ